PNVQDNDTNALAAPGLLSPDKSAGAPGSEGTVQYGPGADAGVVNATLLGRGGATKSRLIREGGGNPASEQAVALGLVWLAKQQKADGSWIYDQGAKEEVIAAT